MATTVLVTLLDPRDAATVRDAGVEVLAEYPDSMLVRGSDAQVRTLGDGGIETTVLPEQSTQVAGSTFAFADAMRAQDVAPIDQDPGRTAYYLVKLAGPAAPQWLDALRAAGAEILDSLPGFTLLVGVLPERLDAIAAEAWVQDVTPYRAAMKVSPTLRRGVPRGLGADSLEALSADDLEPSPSQRVEVTVFPGESVADLAARIRSAGGTVLSTVSRSVVADVSGAVIADLAETQGVQAVLPHAFAEPHNDRAAAVMRVPADHVFGGRTFAGRGQIVGIADSGLDTGVPATVHPDIRGRVAGIVSYPTRPSLAQYVTDPPGHDDGPSDQYSGHGTHVTGSVLGNGAAAKAIGSPFDPSGTAPEAQVFFQAIGQKVTWKTREQLAAEGVDVGTDWPPAASSLWGLPDDLTTMFQQAYAAGARIHTNSWGAPTSGVYNANARAVDTFLWNNPEMLILFSAGNDGKDTDRDGVIDSDSIGTPGTAKNCLTVGASENNRPHDSTPPPGVDRDWSQMRWPKLTAAGHVSDNVEGLAAFSSRGPTDDGRIKPDVVAPGTNVLSALSSALPADADPLWGLLPAGHDLRARYCWSGGTSMSTPLVAGAAALVREALLKDRERVTGALVKAVLVNGATPMAGQFPAEIAAGPNTASGFGRVDVTRAIAPEPGQRVLTDDDPAHAVATGEMRRLVADVPGDASALRVTLVWTDAPALEGVGSLVNQLYLQVQGPDGTVLDGDVRPFPQAVNNVQQVTVPAAAAGRYTIRVRGVSVTRQSPAAAPGAGPSQDFALAVAGATTLEADAGR